MNINKNNAFKLIFSSMLCASLAACGSSKEEIIEEVIEDTLNGVTINASNYQEVMQKGIIDSAKITAQLMFAGNEIDTSLMTISGTTESSFIYDCDNIGGELEVTTIDANTEQWDFDDCHITGYEPDSRYDGSVTINSTINSGDISDIGSYDTDWSVSQAVSMINFTQTSPIDGGDANTSNGSFNLDTSNNLLDELNISTMSSTSLIIDSVDASSGATTSYVFSDLYYDLREDIIDESLRSDLDFTADITNIGDLQMTTDPALVYDTNEVLQSGTVTVTTGNSSARMVATGDNNIEISLDIDNDGNYDVNVPTTWTNIDSF